MLGNDMSDVLRALALYVERDFGLPHDPLFGRLTFLSLGFER